MCTATMVPAVRTNLNSKTPSRAGGGDRTRPQTPTRPPLIPSSETDDALVPPRRSKSRDVTSRYMSSASPSPSGSSNARRFPSPLVSRTPVSSKVNLTPATATATTATPKPAVKRAQSSERRRPMAPHTNATDSRHFNAAAARGVGGGDTASAQKVLFTTTRSFSVSFQGDSFSLQVSKVKPAPSPAPSSLNLRRSTPERRKVTTLSENSKPIESHRWPGRANQAGFANRSLIFDDERTTGSGGSVNAVGVNSPAIGSESASDDSESVSSSNSVGGPGRRGIVVPARFREEASSFRKLSTIESPQSTPRGVVNSRGQGSPVRGPYRPPSPSKAMMMASTPSRGISPSRARSLVPATPSSNYSTNTPSILSFAADLRRGKMAESWIVDAHVLRLLYNRLLQWRFANASADVALSAQKLKAERSIYNAWVSTARLRESVIRKRAELQFIKQTLKLTSILKGQMMYLEEWSLVDQAYTSALSGAIESLRASTLRLPVFGGARAEIQDIKDAICSAVDVLQSMALPLSLLSPKVEEVNSSVSELSSLAAKERALLGQCKFFLSSASALQVKECSVRTQVIQLTRTQT